jgi:cation transport regulator ChaB
MKEVVMDKDPAFDLVEAHRYFSAHCFNAAWSTIDMADRTREDDEAMLHAAHASAWHWAHRPDRTPTNRSVGYWQLSRVYALVGDGVSARRYAEQSMAVSQDLLPFYRGYALEALARAELLQGNQAEGGAHVLLARDLLAQVTDQEERELLKADLDSLQP